MFWGLYRVFIKLEVRSWYHNNESMLCILPAQLAVS